MRTENETLFYTTVTKNICEKSPIDYEIDYDVWIKFLLLFSGVHDIQCSPGLIVGVKQWKSRTLFHNRVREYFILIMRGQQNSSFLF